MLLINVSGNLQNVDTECTRKIFSVNVFNLFSDKILHLSKQYPPFQLLMAIW